MRARALLPADHDDSTLDILEVLYTRVLGPDDHLLLSKGHNPMAFYAVLAATGRLDPALSSQPAIRQPICALFIHSRF